MTAPEMIYPDGQELGWERLQLTDDRFEEEEEKAEEEEKWVGDLWDALETVTRRKLVLDRCPLKIRDLAMLIMSGSRTGRCRKTEKLAIVEIIAALREAGPHQIPLLNFPMVAVPARPPSKAGRPLGKKRGKVKKQFNLFGGDV
ncbi:MAG: hypothetical protein ACYCVY_13030 [Acidiferrobacteraceae bacterium]